MWHKLSESYSFSEATHLFLFYTRIDADRQDRQANGWTSVRQWLRVCESAFHLAKNPAVLGSKTKRCERWARFSSFYLGLYHELARISPGRETTDRFRKYFVSRSQAGALRFNKC